MSLLSYPLQAFVAVVKHTTVHGAAKELRITQTGITQRIRALERNISSTLFIRSRKGMRLTHEGEALFRYCQKALELEGETLTQILGAGKQTLVRVCITGPTSIIESRVVPQCLEVMKNTPNLLITFTINDLENRLDTLKTGKAHIAILQNENVTKELDSKLLKPEEYLLVGTAQWKKRSLKEILLKERLIDFDSSDQMSINYLKKFKLLELTNPERHFVNSNKALIDMIKNGLGYGVLTSDVAQRFIEKKEIISLNSGASYKNMYALTWYPRPEMPEYFHSIIKAIQ